MAMFGDEPPEVQAQIRRRYANKETVAEAERRIEMIALDIAEHFKGKVRPNGFKAQVVAPSRAAALRYAERLNSFGLRAYPVITAAPNDGPEFKTARELDQEQVAQEVAKLPANDVVPRIDRLLVDADSRIWARMTPLPEDSRVLWSSQDPDGRQGLALCLPRDEELLDAKGLRVLTRVRDRQEEDLLTLKELGAITNDGCR